MRYKFPEVGAQLPPKENDLEVPGPTPQGAVNEFLQSMAQQDAFDRNVRLKDYYIRITFANWKLNYTAGRVDGGNPDSTPPAPPAGFMAVCVQNEDTSLGFECQQVGPPVCGIPPYTKLPAPQH